MLSRPELWEAYRDDMADEEFAALAADLIFKQADELVLLKLNLEYEQRGKRARATRDT